MTNQQLWQAVLGELELSLSKANFTTWFRGTFISSFAENKIVVGVPNTFTKAWLEKKYHSAICKALENITSAKIREIIYKIETNKEKIAEEAMVQKTNQTIEIPVIPAETTKGEKNKFGLNGKYTFENFVIGKGNELARAAASAVSDNPGKVYNPLFIHGGVGLGKTHLLQAIGQEVLKTKPKKKVLYVTCEKFTNDFIQAISAGNIESFKNAYRLVDVLLIDDIQFLAGKEGTQEEFFHTFNTLHQDNKQIVISSDRPPKAIPALENRLLSRFEWGMIADIINPDLETRTAILKAKCREKNYTLDTEVINYIATIIQNNIRELEGALNKIMAFNQLNNTESTLENVKSILSTLTTNSSNKSLTPKQIVDTISDFYSISLNDLLGRSREKKLAYPRQVCMFLIREETRSSYPAIGQELGGRDHTTAMHAYSKISKEAENDEKTRQEISLIKQRLYNS